MKSISPIFYHIQIKIPNAAKGPATSSTDCGVPDAPLCGEGHGAVLHVANNMELGEYHIRALDVATQHMGDTPHHLMPPAP